MELSLVLRWIIFSLIWAIIVTMLVASLIFFFTRLCCKRRVEDTAAAGESSDEVYNSTRGIDQTVIETFPKFTYTAARGKKQCRGMLVCVICLGVFKVDETLRSMPKCGHVFHSDCVGSWLKTHNTCPCCRANLDPQNNGSGLLGLVGLA
ncbi:hypothetical protein RND81_09G225100 [Saponaria officinalis]|uniref:RING-type E3 ubiquitin transferase n=1 Tax=Saponaria officinalis TaxID=3572 RepID=A0AAW1IPA8_SAPOF